MKRVLGIALSLLLTHGVLATSTPSKTKLKKVNSQITALKSSLATNKKRKQSAEDKLQKINSTIVNTKRKLKGLKKQIASNYAAINQLQGKENQLLTQRDVERQALADNIRSAYLLGREPYLKYMLNSESVEHAKRQIKYADYIAKARLALLSQLETTLGSLTTNAKALNQQESRLRGLQQSVHKNYILLASRKQEKAAVLSQLTGKIKGQEKALADLIAAKVRLEKLMKQLERTAKSRVQKQDFARLKGRLPWPLNGPEIALFGAPRFHGKLHWEGVVIRARRGAAVKAIASGQIIFADELKGYGKLVIVDHGKGYLSLYGYNSSLAVKRGQQVARGTILARVGSTLDERGSGLYFGIRHYGVALDPNRWCSKR